jgi:hypothetical protein
MEPSNPYQPPVLPTGEGGDMATPIAPGSHLDIHRAIRFFFEDPQWVTKLLMGSLFYLLAFVLIGMVFIAGYMMELIRRSARGERHPLPEWENLGDMFVEGATVLAAYFILVLPAMLLFIVPMMGIGAYAESRGDEAPIAAGVAVVILALALMAVYFALLLYFPAAVVRMALERRFSAAFEFSENFELLKRNFVNFILAILFYMLASFIAQFGMILFCIGIIPAAFWAVCVGAYSFGEVAFRDPARRPVRSGA